MATTLEEPGALSKKESELRATFLYQVSNIPGGKKIKRCIQCGTCTGSCPVSYMMDITPREVIALFRAGDIESILNSRTIWTCASCYACTVRCPVGIKVTDILYALKRLAMESRLFPQKFPVYALSQSFVSVMNIFGKSYEPGLILLYYLKTNPFKLISMLPFTFRMWRKGRINWLPKRIRDRKRFMEIMKEAQIMENIIPEEVTSGSFNIAGSH
jgi:heterodisulfide reductase subunit C